MRGTATKKTALMNVSPTIMQKYHIVNCVWSARVLNEYINTINQINRIHKPVLHTCHYTRVLRASKHELLTKGSHCEWLRPSEVKL